MANFLTLDKVEELSGVRYPPPHDGPCKARRHRKLALAVGLSQFGVNLTRLPPGAWASQRHAHSHEEEFVLMQQGRAIWIDDDGEREIGPGDIIGIPCDGNAHTIVNHSDSDVVYLCVGGRSIDDWCVYPDIGMKTSSNRYAGAGPYLAMDGSPFPGRSA